MIHADDDRQSAAEKAGRKRAGSSQTTPKVALARHSTSVLGEVAESTRLRGAIRRESHLWVGRCHD
jgi:hypothetical protein